MKISAQQDSKLQVQKRQITLETHSPLKIPMDKVPKKSNSEMNLSQLLDPEEFTLPTSLKILGITWNLCGSVPPQQQLLKMFQSEEFRAMPDVIFIGTQQCEISLFWAFFYDSKPNWEAALQKHLSRYNLFAAETLQGLHSAVLVLSTHKDQTYLLDKSVLKAGFCCNLFGNKGATSIKIKMYGQYLQFINCHLAPHQNGAQQRNQTLIRILNRMVCERSSTQVILLGDMNYRLEIKNEEYKQFLMNKSTNNQKKVHYQEMLEIQQLRNQEELKQRFFPLFEEGEIKFPPTYKMSTQNDEYARSRVPGWTDRIFSRKGKIRRQTYDCLYNIYGSDHRPVIASFELDIEQGLSLFEEEAFKTSTCEIM